MNFSIFSLVLFLVSVEVARVWSAQMGKANLKSGSDRDGYCCTTVSFPKAFTGSGSVSVHVAISHGNEFIQVHDASIPWVESVTKTGFKACVVETGDGSSGRAVVNWLAFQTPHEDLECGTVTFAILGCGTECRKVAPAKPLSGTPKIFVTPRHQELDRKQDAALFWVEKNLDGSFLICLREVTNMDGLHKNIKVDWFAFASKPSSLDIQHTNSVVFPNKLAPPMEDKMAYCKNVSFPMDFGAPPTMLVSSISTSSLSCNAINTWIEEITKEHFKVCVKDLVPIGKKHDPITVDYIAMGTLNPCIGVKCTYFAVCKAFGPFDARCVCPEECPDYEEPVCSSNGTSFENKCVFERETCKACSNETLLHPGLCVDFPSVKGRREMKAVSFTSDVYCEDISLSRYAFYPDKPIHIQATVSYFGSKRPAYVHEAAVAWTENVQHDKFTACLAQVGRDERPEYGVATVDWLAYQGAPAGGVAGQAIMREWWSGTTCQSVSLPKGKFVRKPTVLATTQHLQQDVKHDAAYLWVEDVSTSSFRVCLREVQNFDGFHADIYVNWLAFDCVRNPLFSEYKSVYFPNKIPPTYADNGAYCKDLSFERKHSLPPSVLLSANHSTSGGNLDPIYNTITAWVEYVSTTGFRTCVKELYVNKYDPVSVTYTVLGDVCKAGWSYFNGVCHLTSRKCATWAEAQKACKEQGANLITIRNQEDNVYVQNKHNGGGTWLGLSDMAKDGDFCWISDEKSNFTFWKKGDLESPFSADCAFALGAPARYKWCHDSCSLCHNYTCGSDFDECSQGTHECHALALCKNTYGSYECCCPPGYTGDGYDCTEQDECLAGTDLCDPLAQCTNTEGSYECTCKTGFSGDGFSCSDFDECSDGSHECDVNANCTNTAGSYTCSCKPGYMGDGYKCEKSNFCGLEDSKIFQGQANATTELLPKLIDWLCFGETDTYTGRWVRCWRGTSDGFSSRTFHANCDEKGPTVTIVLTTNGYLFGGYSDECWSNVTKYSSSSKAFLFTFYNKHGYKPEKLAMIEPPQAKAIYSSKYYGPTFGSGHDLYIRSDANVNVGSYTLMGYSYSPPHGCRMKSWCDVLGGSNRGWKIKEIEVYYEVCETKK